MTAKKVIKLVPKRKLVERSVVDTLRDAMTDAKVGKLVAVSIVAITPDHGSIHYCSESDLRFALMGGLLAAAQELGQD